MVSLERTTGGGVSFPIGLSGLIDYIVVPEPQTAFGQNRNLS